MSWLNYHHLQYFWRVAHAGGLTAAARELRLAPSTVSAQIQALEAQLGVQLFLRRGRRLELSPAGRAALAQADQIFALGHELPRLVGDAGAEAELHLRVGVADVLPRLLVARALQPALSLPRRVHLRCRQGRPERLAAELAQHELDVVLTDAPLPLSGGGRHHAHPLSAGPVALYAAPAVAARLAEGFPASLDGAPLLVPAEGARGRRGLEDWLAARGLRPVVAAEVDDSALVKALAATGLGAFAMPTAVEAELVGRLGLARVGLLDGLEDRLYALTLSRRPSHAGVRALLASA